VCQIILHSKAEKEVADGVQWYAERSNNAYQRFLKELDTGIELLKKNPKSFPVTLTPLLCSLWRKYFNHKGRKGLTKGAMWVFRE